MMLEFPVSSDEIARWVDGVHIGEIVPITGVNTLANGGEGDIGFLADNSYQAQLRASQIAAIVVAEQLKFISATQIVVADVRRAWRLITERVNEILSSTTMHGIHPRAIVDASVQLGKGVSVAPGAVIARGVVLGDNVQIEALAHIGAGVHIGSDTRIGPGVKILPNTVIGARVNILANAVIGERGFGNIFENGRWIALPQLGGVQIGDDVEIGAATMIDRGSVSNTVIGNGVKLDNLIHIGHNVEIGDNTAIAGCCVIAGSVRIGRNCVVGGASVFNGHITICDGAQFTGHSSVSKSVLKPGLYSSVLPVMPARKWKRFIAKLRIFGREDDTKNYHDN